MKHFAEDEIEAAAQVLRNDGCIAAATDTVYGVCARLSEKAQAKLYEVKQRPKSKRFPVMCADYEQLQTIAELNPMAEAVVKRFMPGPMTVILKKKAVIGDALSGGDTLAIRLATSGQLKQLITLTGTPLFMTSANQSGMPECTTEPQIEEACPKLDGILAGTINYSRASTIVDCTGDVPLIVREGPITAEQINQALREERE